MTLLALVLVFLSSIAHATWNLFAKRTNGGAAFVWLFAALSALLYAPLVGVLLWMQPFQPQPIDVGMMAGSGLLHVFYFLLLQNGYRTGDLSVVYPLARGTGPLVATAIAVMALGEHPSGLALLGAVLVAVGAFLLAGSTAQITKQHNRQAIYYGLLTGSLIAAYTLWDKQAVSVLAIPPLLMDYGSNLSRVLLLTPIAARNWRTVCADWQRYRLEALGIACLSPLSYILVLTALSFTPVSYVAPTREISILLGVILGTRLLAEGNATRRLMAAAVIVLGVMMLVLG